MTSIAKAIDKKVESTIYDRAEVSPITGETEVYDEKIFPNVIRRRELELIRSKLKAVNPKRILDYGCGGGWLSLKLSKLGLDVVGIDISRKMVKNAKLVCPNAEFIVADAENLPFKDNVFDYVIGVSILHHLSDLKQALNELRRVIVNECGFMFMEPNTLNPISAIGRRLFPMEVHTKGEKQFTPMSLEGILNSFGFKVKNCVILFLIAFPLARLFKIMRMNASKFLLQLLYLFEFSMEKNLLMRYLNSTIVVSGLLDKTVDLL